LDSIVAPVPKATLSELFIVVEFKVVVFIVVASSVSNVISEIADAD